jgi:RNA polymerase sigma-70 factor (ECF subfamily)
MKTVLEPERELVLIEAVKKGDRYAFDEIVRAYRQALFGYALGLLKNEEEAKDASQEAFIRAFSSIHQFHGTSQFSTWLFQILINHCRDIFRKKTRRKAVVMELEEREELDQTSAEWLEAHADRSLYAKPDAVNEARELRALLDLATEKLPSRQKEIFLLRYQQGLKLEEIAQSVGSPLGTVKANLFKAVQNMQQILQGLKVEYQL